MGGGLTERERRIFVGVTGHRVLAELEKLTAGIEEALDAIELAFPRCSMTAVTSLAEGADQLVTARILRRPGAGLAVVLPGGRSEYLEELKDPQARLECKRLLAGAGEVVELPASATRSQAYEAAGLEILERSDVLLALWDGLPPQGRGGTGAVVERARSRGLPIAWVHAGNRRAGTSVPTTLGDEQGLVTFEGLPSDPDERPREGA